MKRLSSLIISFALMGNPMTLMAAKLPPVATPPDRQSLQPQMLSNIDFVSSLFDAYYAPANWKKSHSNWNLQAEVDKAKAEIIKNPSISVKQFQRILKRFLSSTHDYHVSVNYESTEFASLPFTVKGAEGRYFFVDIDRSRLSEAVYPIYEGDELITFDNLSADAALQKIVAEEFAPPYTNTDRSLAEMMLTFRTGKKGTLVPKGPIMISVKHAKTGAIKSYQLIWDYTPEEIKDISTKKSLSLKASPNLTLKSLNPPLEQNPFFRKMLSPWMDDLRILGSKKKFNGHDLANRESFVPALGNKLWSSDEKFPFNAYIFQTASGKFVGYVRIPHFKGGVDQAIQFAEIITIMQGNTDALVIDEVNNPGGSLFYMYSLLSTLTDKPLSTPQHRVSINQSDVSFALNYIPLFEMIQSDDDAKAVIGDSFSGNPVTYQFAQFMLNYLRFVVEQWNKGNTLTDLTYFYGVDYINPSPIVNYTKPILVLINELDVSCGDFFPAILQDNKRATLLGTSTSGAGGSVESVEFINLLGIKSIKLTTSIAARADNSPIETLGVKPDIAYALTPSDLQNGYQGYTQAVLQALDKILSK